MRPSIWLILVSWAGTLMLLAATVAGQTSSTGPPGPGGGPSTTDGASAPHGAPALPRAAPSSLPVVAGVLIVLVAAAAAFLIVAFRILQRR